MASMVPSDVYYIPDRHRGDRWCYIGSGNAESRLDDHKRVAWWRDRADFGRVHVDTYRGRGEAYAVERLDIERLMPLCNEQWNYNNPDRILPPADVVARRQTVVMVRAQPLGRIRLWWLRWRLRVAVAVALWLSVAGAISLVVGHLMAGPAVATVVLGAAVWPRHKTRRRRRR